MRRSLAFLALGLAAGCTAEEPKILAVSPLADTRDTAGPYSVTVIASGVSDGDEVVVRYRLAGSPPTEYVDIVAQEGARDDLFVAAIPGQPAGTTVEYYATAWRDALPVVDPPELPLAFRILAPSGFCRADSDCNLGLEICASGTCRGYTGTCVGTPSGLACPGGYVCDTERDPDLCVIAPQACSNDSHCPTVEECDTDRHECVARVPCEMETDCDAGYVCNDNLGLCYRD